MNYYDILKVDIKEYIPFKLCILFIPITLTYIIHYICDYLYCDEWYSLLGLHLFCNACIDAKKILKDHLINIYIYSGTYLLFEMNKLIKTVVKNIN